MKRINTEPVIATYLHRKGRMLGLPIGGSFELTARCNFNCPMCYVHLPEKQVEAAGGELTAKQWLSIAEEAQKAGMVFVLLTGGEPFLRKDFFEIYEGMKKLGLLISINSNGSMIQGEILKKLLKDPPFRINISLYGGSDETYARMCGQRRYEQVKENIAALRQAGVEVSINLSVTPWNQQDIEKIYAEAEKLDVPVKASCYMFPSVRVDEASVGMGNRLSPEEAAHCGVRCDQMRLSPEEFRKRAEALEERISIEPPGCGAEPTEGVRCRAGNSSFWMTWDGRMLPCGMLPEKGVKPLEIGFQEAWEATRQKTAEIRMPSACTACGDRELCPVCAAVCVTETGAYDRVPEYVCRQTREMLQETRRIWKGTEK